MKVPKIIAEIGCNHKGDMTIAKEMILTAASYCKADIVKFQKRSVRELLTSEEYNAPHPHPENSYVRATSTITGMVHGIWYRIFDFCVGCDFSKRDLYITSILD